jgi:alpha-glucosidase
MQNHVYDKSQPENLAFIERLRKLADTYKGRFLLGEIGDDAPLERATEYTQNGRLDTCYSFALMGGQTKQLNATYIQSAIVAELKAGHGKTWPTWAFSNHDVVRAPTRFGHPTPQFSKMLLALLAALRGTICIYQGEELGLTEAKLTYDQLQDPWGKHLWPVWQGRDGCRTPIPWDDTQNAGFSKAQPWLLIPPEHITKSQKSQLEDAASVLRFTQTLLTYRKAHEALQHGDINFIDGPEGTLIFTRHENENTHLCLFNLTDIKISFVHNLKQSGPALSLQAGLSASAVSLEAFGFALIPVSAASNSLA